MESSRQKTRASRQRSHRREYSDPDCPAHLRLAPTSGFPVQLIPEGAGRHRAGFCPGSTAPALAWLPTERKREPKGDRAGATGGIEQS